MDAQYIANNVSVALKEGLAAMTGAFRIRRPKLGGCPACSHPLPRFSTVSHPEDKVDFLGRYLLAYVQRKKKAQAAEDELRDIIAQEVRSDAAAASAAGGDGVS